MKRKQLLLSLLVILFAVKGNAETTVINLSTLVEGTYVGYKLEYENLTITASGDYELTGTTERADKKIDETERCIHVEEGLTVNLTLNNASVINEGSICLNIWEKTTVNMTLKGTNRFYGSAGGGIGISSGKLNIKGSGTLICESLSEGIFMGAGTLTIDGGTVISYGRSMGLRLTYSTFTVNGGVFIGVSVDEHITGIDDRIIRMDLQEAATENTELSLYRDNERIATFNLPAGYTKIDFSASEGAAYSMKTRDTEIASGLTAGNLYKVSLKGTDIDRTNLPTDRIYSNGKEMVIETSAARTVAVYGIDGRMVRTVELREGINTVNRLDAGIYIIDGQKVVVR